MNLKKNSKFRENKDLILTTSLFLSCTAIREILEEDTVDAIEYCLKKDFVILQIFCTDDSSQVFYTSNEMWNMLNNHTIDWKDGF